MSEIAAKMILLTAREEGAHSPIPKLLASSMPKVKGARPTLADRVTEKSPGLVDRRG
ncbi:hypothetical protein D3C86_2151830 [compost metagenome]